MRGEQVTRVEALSDVVFAFALMKKLRDDRKLLIHAATQAQRAADYILNRTCHE